MTDTKTPAWLELTRLDRTLVDAELALAAGDLDKVRVYLLGARLTVQELREREEQP